MSHRKQRIRPWVWISLIGLMVILVAGTRYIGGPLQSVRQLDGSYLRLEAVTFGPNQGFTTGGPLQQLLGGLLPSSLASTMGLHRMVRQSARGQDPVAWVTETGGTARARGGFAALDTDDWSIVDSQGGERPAAELMQVHGEAAGRQVFSFDLHHYPRRQTHVRLRHYSSELNGNKRPVAELAIPNPAPGPYPQWTGPSPPLTATEPDVVATLTAFTNGCDNDQLHRQATRGRVFGSYTGIEVETRSPLGKPSPWQAVDVAFLDATGNVYDRSGYGSTQYAGVRSRLWTNGMLPLDETAWKVRVELARNHTAAFAPEDCLTLSDLPVPAMDSLTKVERELTRQGVKVEFYGLERRFGNQEFDARLWTADPGVRLTLIRLSDEKGRRIPLEPHRDWALRTRLGWTDYSYHVPLSGTEKKLTAIFALQKTRFVEFLATPTHLIPPPKR